MGTRIPKATAVKGRSDAAAIDTTVWTANEPIMGAHDRRRRARQGEETPDADDLVAAAFDGDGEAHRKATHPRRSSATDRPA